MSGTGPESLPTSADPRSRRPLKKRALSPASAQASHVSSLFSRPDQEIRVPSGPPDPRARLAAPPEIVANVQGSSAGAGSGEFHVYKAARRREYERLRVMDEEVRQEREAGEFARRRAELEARDGDRTRKNREKRERMKARRDKAKQGQGQKGNSSGAKAAEKEGGVKPRVDQADEAVEDARDGEAKNGSTDTASKGDVPAAAASTSAPGLVIHDDD